MELEILDDEYKLALESFNNTCDKVIDMLNTYVEVSKMGWFNESRYEDELFTESENLNSEINQMRQKIDKLQSEIENNAKEILHRLKAEPLLRLFLFLFQVQQKQQLLLLL